MMPMQGSLKVEQMCELARVSRAGFYRSFCKSRRGGRKYGSAVGDPADRATAQATYGYRRVTAELKRRGMVVNRKRVARIMREDNLLAVQPKRFMNPLTPNTRWKFI